jgi:pimeloyl-ACP methyl ester carboxylesterase
MQTIAVAVAKVETSPRIQPLAYTCVLQSLLSQDPEGYAKGCTALAGSTDANITLHESLHKTLIVTGNEDRISTPEWCSGKLKQILKASESILPDVGHWALFEDYVTLAGMLTQFLEHST